MVWGGWGVYCDVIGIWCCFGIGVLLEMCGVWFWIVLESFVWWEGLWEKRFWLLMG